MHGQNLKQHAQTEPQDNFRRISISYQYEISTLSSINSMQILLEKNVVLEPLDENKRPA